MRNSIILADETYDRNDCVQFLFEDDQLLAKNTLAAVNKFINVDKVDGVLVYGTPTSLAVTDLVESRHLPMIALSILGRVVQGRQYVVKHWCTAEQLTQAVLAEVKRRAYQKVAIVSTQNDAMLGLRDLYKAAGPTQIVLDEEFIRDTFDFRSIATRILGAKADAVYVLLFPPQTGVFVKQLRELGFSGEVFGVHNMEDPNEVAASHGAMVGAWLANGDETAGEGYSEAYVKRFGTRLALGGGSGYDTAKLFIEAAQQTNQDLNTYLHSVRQFHGAFGVYNASGRNDFDFPAVIKVIEKDSFRTLAR